MGAVLIVDFQRQDWRSDSAAVISQLMEKWRTASELSGSVATTG
jgi:hypothetical protein